MDLDARVDGLNVRDRGEQVRRSVVNVETGETVIRGRRERIACV